MVYPSALLPTYRRFDAKLVIINRDPTDLDREADLVIRDDIASVFERLLI